MEKFIRLNLELKHLYFCVQLWKHLVPCDSDELSALRC